MFDAFVIFIDNVFGRIRDHLRRPDSDHVSAQWVHDRIMKGGD